MPDINLQEKNIRLQPLLQKLGNDAANIFPFDLTTEPYYVFDFSGSNLELTKIDLSDTAIFCDYVERVMKQHGARYGIGKYNENRVIYKRSRLFDTKEEARTLHLGIDVWAEAGTPLQAPLNGVVHSFADNNTFGDYGPTIILEHESEGEKFYTLYGHLARKSLDELSVGNEIKKGEQFAWVGQSDVNGHWPPHLHFEIILDMLGKKGDFPGVAKPSESSYWLAVCPDPNSLLHIPFEKI